MNVDGLVYEEVNRRFPIHYYGTRLIEYELPPKWELIGFRRAQLDEWLISPGDFVIQQATKQDTIGDPRLIVKEKPLLNYKLTFLREDTIVNVGEYWANRPIAPNFYLCSHAAIFSEKVKVYLLDQV